MLNVAIEASTWINRRGYGRFTRELTRALLRAGSGHRFTLVLDSGAAAADDLPDALRVVVDTGEAVVNAAASDASRSPRDLWGMSRALSATAFDVVLFPTLYSYVPVLSRGHVTVVVHDAMPETMPDLVLGSVKARALWRVKTWLACRRADTIATVSQASAEAIRAHLPVGVRDITVLSEGVAQDFTPNRDPHERELIERWAPDRTPYVLYVGGFSPHKRIPALIRAFSDVAVQPAHATLRLVLAGPGDLDTFRGDHDEIRSALGSLPAAIAARVVLTGFVTDQVLAALYRGAHCVVLPSIAEGFGLPALEAMASGAPLLATRSPALVELCDDAAEFFDDVRELPSRLGAVLADEARRREMRERGPLRAAGYGWDEAARRWLAVMERHRAGSRHALHPC